MNTPTSRSFRLDWICIMIGCLLWSGAIQADAVDFERDIRPVLSENCFQCHGPDAESRKADLRLDSLEHATADLGGYAAVVPGDAAKSALIERITAIDPGDIMPPPASKRTLTPEQIQRLKDWIDEGAEWPAHWAFVPPTRPMVPGNANTDWERNPIDAFVLARLNKEELTPAKEADPLTLLRRLHLDIIGLPPTIDEIDAYLADDPATAYDNAVNRLLDSPHFGERWARRWLDAAQFADSDGFEKDKPRQVWAWRDYVINALNANMPYDQFVTEQIAGDLLPGATQDQIVATGFLRNSMINEEGGIDPEQFRMEAVFNRMDVIGRAVLGLTVACAQCHTHKYDPLTHTDYYRMLSYINNAYEACMTVYSEEEQAQRDEVLAEVAAIDAAAKESQPGWQEQLQAWIDTVAVQPQPDWHPVTLEFDDSTAGGQKFLPQDDASYLSYGYAPTRFSPKMAGESPLTTITAIRLDLLNDPNLPRNGPGRSIYGAGALSEFEFRVAPEGGIFEEFDQWERVEVASAIADVNPPKRTLGAEFPTNDPKETRVTGPIAMAIDGDGKTAWTIDNGAGRTNQPRYAIFTLKEAITLEAGTRIGFRLAQNHGGNNSDDNQTNNLGRFRLSVTDSAALPSEAVPFAIQDILAKDPEARSAEEEDMIFRHWRRTNPAFAAANIRAEMAWKRHPWGATQLVYREMPTPRETYRLARGDFLSPEEQVKPGVPEFLHALDREAPPDRRSLAAWLVDRDAPTTARAYVNRIWQGYFGEGIVDTPSDLGSQGAPPSHPALLDWLAVEFMDSGWDIKHIHRLIVQSATYRQDSSVTPEQLERDPKNRLLARGARYRVEGEIVRDIAMAASGLLDRTVGGPSVYPPAPEFLFQRPASYGPKVWNTAEGSERYRRGLYTFRFRSVPYPALQVFDTPPGDAPCVRRGQSNTPLQALTLLNEPVFVDCSKSLAREILAAKHETDAARIEYAFRRCTARTPDAQETDTLLQFLTKQRARIAAGELTPAEILESDDASAELAAWTLTARVMLNLDETITRQ